MTTIISAVEEVPVNKIFPSNENPRNLNQRDPHLKELAQSIKTAGLIQPIAIYKPVGKGLYEIIHGERRWRATRIAKLDTIPAIIHSNISEDEARMLRAAENKGREDPDPFLEVENVTRLCETHSLVDVAKIMCMPVDSIRLRRNLSKLIPEFREWVAKTTIDHATGNPEDDSPGTGAYNWPITHFELIARFPPETQARLLSWAKKEWRVPSVSSIRRVGAEQTLDLKDATWDLGDETLGKATSCLLCEKKLSVQSDLFGGAKAEIGDVKDDVCLDKVCFRRKLEIQNRKDIRTLKERYPEAPQVKLIEPHQLPKEMREKRTAKGEGYAAEDRGMGLWAFYEIRKQKKPPKNSLKALTRQGELIAVVPIGTCQTTSEAKGNGFVSNYGTVGHWHQDYKRQQIQRANDVALDIIEEAANTQETHVIMRWMVALLDRKEGEWPQERFETLKTIVLDDLIKKLWQIVAHNFVKRSWDGYNPIWKSGEDCDAFYASMGANWSEIMNDVLKAHPKPAELAEMPENEKVPEETPDAYKLFQSNLEESNPDPLDP